MWGVPLCLQVNKPFALPCRPLQYALPSNSDDAAGADVSGHTNCCTGPSNLTTAPDSFKMEAFS